MKTITAIAAAVISIKLPATGKVYYQYFFAYRLSISCTLSLIHWKFFGHNVLSLWAYGSSQDTFSIGKK